MREFSILLISLLFNFSSAQTYHFNLVTKYTSSNVKDKILRDHVQNNYTDDFSYYLESLKWNSELTTRIDDMERNLLHYFSVEEIKQGSEVQFEFTYLTSIRLTGQRISKKYRYGFTEN